MKKPRTKIKAKPLCSRLRRVVRAASDQAEQKGQNPELAKHAAAIRTLGKRVVTDIIEIGRRLTEAKKIVGHGKWAEWLEIEFDWSEGTALNFMRVYNLAEDFKTINFTDLTFADLVIAPSALYVLAQPGTSREVRNEIIDRAAAGEAITHSTVQEVRANHVAAAVQEALAPPLAPAADEADTPTPAADEADTPTSAADEAVNTPPAADEAVNTPPAADEADTIDAVEEALSPDDPEKENLRRWFDDVVTRASRAMEDGEVANSPLSPERRQIFQEVVEPMLLPTLRKGGEGLIKLADFLDKLFDEASPDEA